MRNAMFSKLLRLDIGFFDGNSLGAVVSKFTFDVNQVAEASTKVITVFCKRQSSSLRFTDIFDLFKLAVSSTFIFNRASNFIFIVKLSKKM